MTLADDAAVLALVAHARDVPAVERQRFAAELRGRFGTTALVIETCHRVEAYLVAPEDRRDASTGLPAGGRLLVGEAAIRQAIAVAVGRDSVVIGEDQILHQLRRSLDEARAGGRLDPGLERLFSLALRAGRRARSWRQGPRRSLADVALSAIERQCGSLRGRDVLIVGAGKVGRLAAQAAATAGASVSAANRSPGGADVIAAATGARIEAFDPGPAIDKFAGVIIAISGPWTVGPATVERLAAGSTVVVDLSVPAAVAPSLARGLGVRLVSADGLALMDVPVMDDDRSLARLDALIESTTAEFRGWLEGRMGRAAAEALTQRADGERLAELDELWRRLPGLDAHERAAIERMSQHLAKRLLREPLEHLGRDADGRHERAARQLFGL